MFHDEQAGTQRLKREKDGFDEIVAELAKSVPTQGAKAGITPEVYQRFVDRTAQIEKVREKRAEVDKMAEVLRETEAALEHAREGDIAVMAKALQTTIKHVDPAVAVLFADRRQGSGDAAQERRGGGERRPERRRAGLIGKTRGRARPHGSTAPSVHVAASRTSPR
jgi:hypothetical protein